MTVVVNESETKEIINHVLGSSRIVVFTTKHCRNCNHVTDFLKSLKLDFRSMAIDGHTLYRSILHSLYNWTGQTYPPFVFINNSFVGNHESVISSYHNGLLTDLITGKEKPPKYDYDVIVVGGSSEGLAMAVEAGNLGKSVGLFDNTPFNRNHPMYPSVISMTGNGTLVKSLMLQSCLTGESGQDGNFHGWNLVEKDNFDWSQMMNHINKHINKLNEDFKAYFSTTEVKIFTARVLKFVDDHTVLTEDSGQRTAKFTGQVFVIATGGIPEMISFPGVEYAITVENLIDLQIKPIKTLIIGDGHIALEYAGILNALGVEVSILVKGNPMMKFDSQIASMIVSHLKSIGVQFIYLADEGYEIFKRNIAITEQCKAKACAVSDPNRTDFAKHMEGEHEYPLLTYRLKLDVVSETTNQNTKKQNEFLFDTIILAAGRKYLTRDMELEKLGVQLNEENGKIIVNKYDRTHCPTIFAIGDVAHIRPEPVSPGVKSGQLLARRMCGSHEIMIFNFIPMVVLTPLQYGFCGYTVERAVEKYAPEDINIYETNFYPIQWLIQKRNEHRCYMKIICLKTEEDRVLGVHILGPKAAEIIQGIGLAMTFNLKKSHLDTFVGLHATNAEALFGMQLKDKNTPVFFSGCFATSVKTNHK